MAHLILWQNHWQGWVNLSWQFHTATFCYGETNVRSFHLHPKAHGGSPFLSQPKLPLGLWERGQHTGALPLPGRVPLHILAVVGAGDYQHLPCHFHFKTHRPPCTWTDSRASLEKAKDVIPLSTNQTVSTKSSVPELLSIAVSHGPGDANWISHGFPLCSSGAQYLGQVQNFKWMLWDHKERAGKVGSEKKQPPLICRDRAIDTAGKTSVRGRQQEACSL